MYKFSEHSKQELNTIHPDLRAVCEVVIETFDFTVLEGHRSRQRQNRLYKQGKSQLQYPESKHNSQPSRAVDLAPYPIDWTAERRFYHVSGHMKMAAHMLRERGEISHELRWGGDWDSDHRFDDNQFDDLPHYELG
jgi:peptidoglycan L-alanyl-D-glutamate endopeptidase CwlK